MRIATAGTAGESSAHKTKRAAAGLTVLEAARDRPAHEFDEEDESRVDEEGEAEEGYDAQTQRGEMDKVRERMNPAPTLITHRR